MKDDPEFNIRFVSIIESNPCIYDHSSIAYSNKHLQEKTWEKISNELNEPVSECRDRWKNLRGSYTRHLKHNSSPNGSVRKRKKPYYLAEHMAFLRPFTKSRQGKSSTPQSCDNNDEDESNDTLPDVDCGVEDVNKPLRTHFQAKKSHLHTLFNEQAIEDPDVLFLMSILPDMKEMNDSQKRRFKINILTTAGSILNENTNLPGLVPIDNKTSLVEMQSLAPNSDL